MPWAKDSRGRAFKTGSGGASGPPTLTLAEPVTGPQAGGTLVTLTGSGFRTVTMVNFEDYSFPSASFTIVSDTEITVTSPAAPAPGLADIWMQNAKTETAGLTDVFDYV